MDNDELRETFVRIERERKAGREKWEPLIQAASELEFTSIMEIVQKERLVRIERMKAKNPDMYNLAQSMIEEKRKRRGLSSDF